jgi:hypothetical protein
MKSIIFGIIAMIIAIAMALLTKGLFLPVALPLMVYGFKLCGVNLG